jgi:cytoskeletal protein CcmA (bactofilin family)
MEMHEERGQLIGDQIISRPLDLFGTIAGNVHVVDGGKVYLRGAIYGDLTVTHGGRVHIFGQVTGNLKVLEGAKVIHSGVVGGDATNLGGRLFIENSAKVLGKLRRKEGKTTVEPKAEVRE